MVVAHKLRMDMEGKKPLQWIDVVQGDAYTRNVELQLFSGHQKWSVPEGAAILIRYRKPDGKCGVYDTLPDGTAAWYASGNKLTIMLVPQVLTTVGSVMLNVSIASKNRIINTFAIEVRVSDQLPAPGKGRFPGRRIEVSEDYYFVTGMLPVPDTAEIGQIIRVSAVNQLGKPTRTEAVDMPQTGSASPEEIQKNVWSFLQENPPADGKTPVKGEDYWTEEDLDEIYTHIDTQITDRFGKGVAIPTGADLNQYLEIGKYYASSDVIASSLVNCPTKQDFTMYVFMRTNVKSQMIIDLAGKLYIRSSSASAWRDWVSYVTNLNLSSAITAALAEAKESGAFETSTPVKGVDYWTDAEREAMIQEVIEALGTPVFGTVDDQNNIILSGNLVDGTYTIKYEHADGKQVLIGSLNTEDVLMFYVGKIDNSTGTIDPTVTDYAYTDEVPIESSKNYIVHHDALAISIKLSMWDADGNFLSSTSDLYNQIVGNEEAGTISLNQHFVNDAAYFRLRIYVFEDMNGFITKANNGAISIEEA